ncbi:hypothetical protein [Mesorhizobium sp. LNJC405B00]|uniref:hypothetical protein n=1 Tax=unclassified Mesorhizobium TaxID=325217 RepID=UPI0003CE9023|nr:hypothetical protein [Mesorhizobium sp. LNJC405B00]ESX97847.1 hypothetical protein X755_17680 [Mesorhizobium sp. LNJC405B00]
MALRRTFRVTLLSIPLLTAAACVPQNGAPTAVNTVPPTVAPAPAQQSAPPVAPPASATAAAPAAPPAKIVTDLTAPRSAVGTATYRCGNGGVITIQNLGTALRVVRPDGTTEEFAASPANQSSRYQEAASHDAIVIDAREALVMKRGSTPQTCKR